MRLSNVSSELKISSNVIADFSSSYSHHTSGIPRFYDIGGFLAEPEVFQRIVDIFVARYAEIGIDSVAGLDARGFILGPPVRSQRCQLLWWPMCPRPCCELTNCQIPSRSPWP